MKLFLQSFSGDSQCLRFRQPTVTTVEMSKFFGGCHFAFGGTDSLRHVLMVDDLVRSGRGFEVCYMKDHYLSFSGL